MLSLALHRTLTQTPATLVIGFNGLKEKCDRGQRYGVPARLSLWTSMETMWCPGTMARPSTRGSPAENESGKKKKVRVSEQPSSIDLVPENKGRSKACKRKCLAVRFRRIPEVICVP